MKKKVLILAFCSLALYLSACGEGSSGTTVEDTESAQLAQDYAFYGDSVDKLEDGMNLGTSQANGVFKVLIDVGLDEEISYCFDKDEFYKVWWGSNNVDVYLADGTVEKIMDGDKQLYPISDASKETADPITKPVEVTNLLECPVFTAEKNSSDMVDQIASTAKEYANQLTDEQAAEIINIIREADHEFYNGPEEMEKFMWYGYLLDYKYDDSDVRSELGMDLYQAIKYVYRGAETVLDDATKENLNQIDESLNSIQ